MAQIAHNHLKDGLINVDHMRSTLDSYDATQVMIQQMIAENEQKLVQVHVSLQKMVRTLKDLAGNPQAKNKSNAKLLGQLSKGMKDVLQRTKKYPTWTSIVATNTPSKQASRRMSMRVTKDQQHTPATGSRRQSRARFSRSIVVTPVKRQSVRKRPVSPIEDKAEESSTKESEGETTKCFSCEAVNPSPCFFCTHCGLQQPKKGEQQQELEQEDSTDSGADEPSELRQWMDDLGLIDEVEKLEEFDVDLRLLSMASAVDLEELGLPSHAIKKIMSALHPELGDDVPLAVGEFLDKIGLPQYKELMDEYEVDLDMLKLSSEIDLLELGIPAEDARKIIVEFSDREPEPASIGEYLERLGVAEHLDIFEEFDVDWNLLKMAGSEDLRELEIPDDVIAVIAADMGQNYPDTQLGQEEAKRLAGPDLGWEDKEYEHTDADLGPFETPWESIEIGKKIGEGGFATVHLGTWNGQQVAVKVLKFKDMTPKDVQDYRREAGVLSQLDHPNVTKFLAASSIEPNLAVVMEYVERGALSDMLWELDTPLPWALRMSMVTDVAAGVHYLHSRIPRIIHRDIKSSNVLVRNNWQAVLCDFGLVKIKTKSQVRRSVMINPSRSSQRRSIISPSISAMGTPAWAAPELLGNESYSESVDTYSYGVFLWECIAREKPHKGKSDYDVVMDVHTQGVRPEIPGGFPASYTRLVELCWEPTAQKRPNFSAILQRLEEIKKETSTFVAPN